MPALKQHLRRVLNRLGIFYRLRNSWIHDLFWTLTRRPFIEDRTQELEFYRHLLQGFHAGDLIFDVGANAGDKTDIFLRLGARVVSIEPDEANQEILRGKFLRWRWVPKPVVVVGKAVSDRSAVETMWIDGPGSAVNTLSQKWVKTLKTRKDAFAFTTFGLHFSEHKKVETTTLEELIQVHGSPFFVKVDVEGHETSVLRGLKYPVPFLSFEVNLPEFMPEGLECVHWLGRLTAGGEFNYATDLKRGMMLEKWLGSDEFSIALQQCSAEAAEVFWRVPLARSEELRRPSLSPAA